MLRGSGGVGKAARPEQLQVILEEAERVNSILAQDYTTLRAAKDDLTKKLSVAMQDVERLYQKVEGLTSQLSAETLERGRALAKYEEERKHRMDLEHVHAEMGGKLSAHMDQIKALQSNLQDKEKTSTTESVPSSEVDHLRSLLEEATTRAKDLQHENEKLQARCTEEKVKLDAQQKELVQLREDVARIQSDLELERTSHKESVSRHQTLQEDHNTHKTKEENTRITLEAEIKSLRDQLAEEKVRREELEAAKATYAPTPELTPITAPAPASEPELALAPTPTPATSQVDDLIDVSLTEDNTSSQDIHTPVVTSSAPVLIDTQDLMGDTQPTPTPSDAMPEEAPTTTATEEIPTTTTTTTTPEDSNAETSPAGVNPSPEVGEEAPAETSEATEEIKSPEEEDAEEAPTAATSDEAQEQAPSPSIASAPSTNTAQGSNNKSKKGKAKRKGKR
eukprot:TRINITY_DN5425_c1_g1_i1.p1 TRINITY_DN5425_c1_g1~~TRINITY_DN5425_c1_g1_i1.p1  ORF type:complete len:451 (+),score=111.15 TRINITY_DN5425_c1_g1_i1:44-1396(+)